MHVFVDCALGISMRLLTLFALLLSSTGSLCAQDLGVLVVLATHDSSHRYHPLWIPEGTNALLDLDELILPRKDGFWRIGSRTTCSPGDNDDLNDLNPNVANVIETEELWIVPVSKPPSLKGPLSCERALRPSEPPENTAAEGIAKAEAEPVEFVALSA